MSDPIRTALGFAACTIKSGESYTLTCDEVFGLAHQHLEGLEAERDQLKKDLETMTYLKDLNKERAIAAEQERDEWKAADNGIQDENERLKAERDLLLRFAEAFEADPNSTIEVDLGLAAEMAKFWRDKAKETPHEDH